SDVPFCLHGGTAMGGGHGEDVSPVLAKGHFQWVFAIADRGLSTAQVYAEFDGMAAGGGVAEPQVSGAQMSALRSGDPATVGAALSNDLQPAAVRMRPELEQALEIGLECDARGALVCGAGPTTMYLARDERHAM